MKRMFFSQAMLDSMVDTGKIKVDKGVLTMLAGDNPTFRLLPAYRIVKTIDGKPDPSGLVGQIRSETELKLLGAEAYADSVIFKDVAYQADTGFIAVKFVPGQSLEAAPAPKPAAAAAPAAVAAVPSAAPPAQAVPQVEVVEPPADKAKDGDELSKFILDNLL